MTERTKPFVTNHNQYGGEITIEDFNTYSPNKNRINNQSYAVNFSYELQKQKNRERKLEQYTKMTLEELRETNLIKSKSDGRPTSDLTDEKWQKEFEIRKIFVQSYKDGHTKKLSSKYSKESSIWNEETKGTYYGCTNWQSYCTFINDILRNIRAGQVDYCYYIYQIMDLAKFHFHDLKTKYCDGYWEVWLNKK